MLPIIIKATLDRYPRIFYLRHEDILELVEDVSQNTVDVKFKNSVSQNILRIEDCTVDELHNVLMSGKFETLHKQFRRMK